MRCLGVTILTALSAFLINPVSAIGSGFDRAIAAAMPRVVKLYGLGAGLQAGYGTGVIVSEDGLVLTVYSLLIDARRIRAVTSDGTVYEADVVHRDSQRQLALLQLKPVTTDEASALKQTVGPFPFFDPAHEATLRPGDWVLAAGNSFKVAHGAEPLSLAHGVFSARTRLDARRRLRDFPYRGDVLVIDAITSNPGAPGSALVNLDGDLVGMIGRQVVSNLTHTHFNHAVPRDVLYEYFVEVTATDSDDISRQSERERLAAVPQAEPPFDPGIRLSRTGYQRVLPFVEHVRSGSPADQAGVRKDDLILSVNGRNVPDTAAYEARVNMLAPDEPIDLVIRRGRGILSIRVETSKSQNVETSKSQNVEKSKQEGSEQR